MALPQAAGNCPRCGLRRTLDSEFCAACGFDYTNASARSREANQPPSAPTPLRCPGNSGQAIEGRPAILLPVGTGRDSSEVSEPRLSLPALMGWQVLRGTVIAVEPTYMAKREFELPLLLAKVLLVLVLLPLFVAVGVTVLLFSLLFSFLGSSREGSGFFSKVASQTLSFFLTGKLFGPPRQIAVRDVRVRDAAGLEHLVRIQGELRAGSLAVGDEVQLEGFDRRGTLMFRRGWNNRIRSEIIVKRK